MTLRWPINLLEDGSVVTRDGEVLGTWQGDENDHPTFTSTDGSVQFFHPFIPMLCEQIEKWRNERAA